MKTCTKCGKKKPLEEFHWRNKAAGIRQARCKACAIAASMSHYARNTDVYRQRNMDAAKRKSEYIKKLRCNPCMDCGIEYPPYVMEFDHREPSKKGFSISGYGTRRSWKQLNTELAKCDLVCANCHCVRTHQRRAGVVKR